MCNKSAYTNARPTTQMTQALIPWAIRARTITQNAGASMRSTWEPINATWPQSNGILRFLYISERNAIGGVTGKCGVIGPCRLWG